MTVKIFKSIAATALTLVVVACQEKARQDKPPPNAAAATNRTSYHVKGVVKELKVDGKTVVIQHEKIPGYMEAMTMPFQVKHSGELASFQPEDKVSFRLVVTEDDSWIENVTKLAGAIPNQLPAGESLRRVRDVEPLKVGDLMPDYRFTNELGRVVRFRDYMSQAVAFTFFFTTCPLPDFCPRMSKNFAATYKQLRALTNAPANWRLLSITFDVQRDTPVALKAYADSHRYDSRRWSFLTGALIDIDALTEQFGLFFSRQQSGLFFDHNLRTVVIDTQGRIKKIIIGNTWQPEELVAEIIQAAQQTP